MYVRMYVHLSLSLSLSISRRTVEGQVLATLEQRIVVKSLTNHKHPRRRP